MDGIVNHFLAAKCSRLPNFAYKISLGGVDTTGPLQKRPAVWTHDKFPLSSPALPLFLFYETTTGERRSKQRVLESRRVDFNTAINPFAPSACPHLPACASLCISPVELGLNIAQNGTEIKNISFEAEFHFY